MQKLCNKAIIYASLLSLITPRIVSAAEEPAARLSNPLSSNSLVGFLCGVVTAIQMILWPILVLAVVAAGFLLVTARGNEQKLTAAKRILVGVMIGVVIVLGADEIVTIVVNTVRAVIGSDVTGAVCS